MQSTQKYLSISTWPQHTPIQHLLPLDTAQLAGAIEYNDCTSVPTNVLGMILNNLGWGSGNAVASGNVEYRFIAIAP